MMHVLWLASWYPNTISAFEGDFIERHAIAVSAHIRLTVLFVAKDDRLPMRTSKIEKHSSGQLTVYRCYYGPSFRNKLIEKISSFKKFRTLQQQLYYKIIAAEGVPDLVHVQVAMKAGLLALYLKKKIPDTFPGYRTLVGLL